MTIFYRIGIVAVLMICTTAGADIEQTTSTTTQTRDDATELSETERDRAAIWDLDEAEWQRYDTLLLGIRGSISPATLSPIEVLGIHARDEAERRHYAERWARAMREDAERVLAFQRAYSVAFQRLFGDQELIDVARLAGRKERTPNLQAGDRLLLFAKLNCPSCDAVLTKVLPHVEAIDGADIYFLGDENMQEQAIRDWAKRQNIDAGWLRSRRITVNWDNGMLHSIDANAQDVPLLFVRRDGAVSPFAYAQL